MALAVAPAIAQATPGESPPPKQSLQWFERAAPGEVVRVLNPLGDVYARFGGYEEQVEILATIQKLDPALPRLEVARERTESGLDITARYVSPPPGGSTGSAAKSDDRIDLVVFVPIGANLEVETRDGLIEVKGLKSDVLAATVTGDVRIRSIEGRVRANSARGEIAVAFENGATKEPQELVTQTGDITAHLWEDADMEVHIATSGEISTDFSIEIQHRRFEEPAKFATAVVGKGGAQLHLKSKRGRVRLLRLQKDFRPES